MISPPDWSCPASMPPIITKSAPAPNRDDVAVEAVGGVGALEHGRELRVADASLLAGGADRARADPDLDYVGAGEDELLDHLAGDHVARLFVGIEMSPDYMNIVSEVTSTWHEDNENIVQTVPIHKEKSDLMI